MAVELKEVIEKATTKKELLIRGVKGTGNKMFFNYFFGIAILHLKKNVIRNVKVRRAK
jgi:hypothetical protein